MLEHDRGSLTAMDQSPGQLSGQRSRENEERFARANGEIERTASRMELQGPVPFLCECSETRCTEIIHLSLDSYRAAKADGALFMVLPGHIDAKVERIVSEGDGFVLVEKYQ
jgi:hypothetical protein